MTSPNPYDPPAAPVSDKAGSGGQLLRRGVGAVVLVLGAIAAFPMAGGLLRLYKDGGGNPSLSVFVALLTVVVFACVFSGLKLVLQFSGARAALVERVAWLLAVLVWGTIVGWFVFGDALRTGGARAWGMAGALTIMIVAMGIAGAKDIRKRLDAMRAE